MKGVEVSRTIAATPARVWALVTDLADSERVIKGITKIERLDDGQGFGIGTRWRETRIMFGREATEEMEVTAIDEGHSYVVEADSKGAHYRSVITVDAADEGTLLTMSFVGEPKGVAAKALAATLGRMFQGATRKAFEKDVADIAAAVESEH